MSLRLTDRYATVGPAALRPQTRQQLGRVYWSEGAAIRPSPSSLSSPAEKKLDGLEMSSHTIPVRQLGKTTAMFLVDKRMKPYIPAGARVFRLLK